MFICCKIVSCLTNTPTFFRLKTLNVNKVLLTEWPIMILWECRGVIFLGVAHNHSLELRQLVFTAIGIIADAFLTILYIFEIVVRFYQVMDPLMDMLHNSEEPEWLERRITGDLRLWQVMFLFVASLASLIVIVCCCFRFRIPRTKQQIEADYQRRKITTKFRAKLETIQDAKMDAMSLKDALDLLHEQTNINMEGENQQGSQPSSIMSPQQSSLDASFQPEGGQKPEQQASGLSFVKFASKVATLSKLGQPKSPTSPTPSGNDNKMDF